jgi:hypothetical protein
MEGVALIVHVRSSVRSITRRQLVKEYIICDTARDIRYRLLEEK